MITRILVVGGSGMLGKPVACQLQAKGYQVRIFSRNPQRARAAFPPLFEVSGGDVDDPATLETALRGCQAVHINLHGLFDADLERRGAENVARCSSQAKLERITYLSGASVCPENAWFPDTRARLQAEQAICACGVDYTIFRAHFFMETLRNFVRGRVLLQIGRHPHAYPWVAAADYAGMVARAYATPQSVNKTLFICGPEGWTMRQALRIVQRVKYPRYRLVYLPLWLARIIARVGGRRELESVLPFFAYCEKVKIIQSGAPDEANALLGAPVTSLETWVRTVM